MSAHLSDKQFTPRLEMTSDWHIGTGAGIPGSVDALLARDADGFPCVPAKSIVGIWRDAMETLTFGLDNGDPKHKVWQKWVDVIFGSQPNIDTIPTDTPRPSILSIQPAQLNEKLRKAIGDDKRLRQALTFIKPNTAIEASSGTAKSESLRFTEMGRVGTVLETDFALNFDLLENASHDQKRLIEALLVASAALIERIGGNRRRGSGKCEMHIEGAMTKEDAVKAIRQYQTVHEITTCKPHEGLKEAPQSVNGVGWKRIKYSLTLQTPVAIVTNTLGNVSETLDFIPGTYLLPHITRQVNGISKYVAAGDFQVSPATIEVGGNRGCPVPKVIFHRKSDGGFNELETVYNRIREAKEVEDPSQKKNYRVGYVSDLYQVGTLPSYETTKQVLLMHNTVKDEIQRPHEDVGGVFSRQAIKAGITLHGVIRFKDAIEDEVKGLEKLSGTVRLGTSKKDDYGLAKLTLGEVEPDTSSANITNTELIVYLESDVLIRNGGLRQTNLVDDLKTELEKHLAPANLKCVDDLINEGRESIQQARAKLEKDPNDLESQSIIEKSESRLKDLEGRESSIQVRRIESWHEGWRFPRPTLTAMAAGSVVTFETDGTIDITQLQNLELSGIGERRGEGYGWIRINPGLLTNRINGWVVAVKKPNDPMSNSESLSKLKKEILSAAKLKEFVSIIELSAWRNELARAVIKIAGQRTKRHEIFGFEIHEQDGKKSSIPSLSQIGGLRSAFGRVAEPKDQRVIGWLDHLAHTSNRLEIWDRRKDREKAKKKLEKIKTLISDENEVWKVLTQDNSSGVSYLCAELVTPGDDLQSSLWTEAVKALFDACARAHKRDVEREEMKEGKANG